MIDVVELIYILNYVNIFNQLYLLFKIYSQPKIINNLNSQLQYIVYDLKRLWTLTATCWT